LETRGERGWKTWGRTTLGLVGENPTEITWEERKKKGGCSTKSAKRRRGKVVREARLLRNKKKMQGATEGITTNGKKKRRAELVQRGKRGFRVFKTHRSAPTLKCSNTQRKTDERLGKGGNRRLRKRGKQFHSKGGVASVPLLTNRAAPAAVGAGNIWGHRRTWR